VCASIHFFPSFLPLLLPSVHPSIHPSIHLSSSFRCRRTSANRRTEAAGKSKRNRRCRLLIGSLASSVLLTVRQSVIFAILSLCYSVRSFVHSVSLAILFGHSDVQTKGLSFNWSFGQSTFRPVYLSVNQSIGQSVIRSVRRFGHLVIRSVCCCVIWSVCHSVSLTIGQSVIRSVCYFVVRSVCYFVVLSLGFIVNVTITTKQ